MLKKFLYLTIILFFIISLINHCYSTELLMNLENNTNSGNNPQFIDNTTYSDSQVNDQNSAKIDISNEPLTTTLEADYENYDDELSISSIINIILIAVGFVLVLLGIAIIIKLK